jgi:hypothetical protein
MARVLSYFGRAIFRPRRTFERLQTEPHRFTKGLKAVVLVGILYALAAGALAAGGALVVAPALLPLPPQNYYVYEIVFALPVFVLAWILAAVTAQFLGLFGSGGRFSATLGSLGVAFALPALLMWLPMAAFGVLLLLGMGQTEFMDHFAGPGFWRFAAWAYQALAALWLIVLVTKAVAVCRGFKGPLALAAGTLTAAVFLAVVIVFIR